jgi:hypothetical protein
MIVIENSDLRVDVLAQEVLDASHLVLEHLRGSLVDRVVVLFL